MTINETFDIVFCINLMRRPDRRTQTEAEFTKHGIQVEFVEAIDGKELTIPHMLSSDGLPISNGDIGCVASHAMITRTAKARGLKNYLVYEDDIELKTNFNELFPIFMAQVPDDWQLLYLGGSFNGEVIPVSENVVKATNVFTTHAMAVKEDVYDALIEVWEKQNEKVDLCVASLQTKFNTYVFNPFLVGQRPSYSDILEKETDYEHLRV